MITLEGYSEQIQVPLVPQHVRILQQSLTRICHIICLGPQNVSVKFLYRRETNEHYKYTITLFNAQ
jgi:hypothetical protein